MAITLLRRGQPVPVPPVDKAIEFLDREGRRPRARCPGAVGSSGRRRRVRAGLEEVAAEYGADEVSVVTITYDHGARRRSYELIADAMGLSVAEAGASATG